MKKKKTILIVVLVFLILGAIGSCSDKSGSENSTESVKTTIIRTDIFTLNATSEKYSETLTQKSKNTTKVTKEQTEKITTEKITKKSQEFITSAEIPTTKKVKIVTAKANTESSKQTYILNTNTEKFHCPYCSSVKQMNDENKEEFYGTREEVINKGFTPCGKCKP